MKAAILYELNTPLKVEEIEIPRPAFKEVLVKVKAVGVCHTDLHPIKGDMPVPLPIVLGHEGAGIVEEIGEGVTTVKPGDHVIMFPAPFCGSCISCLTGMPYLCMVAGPVLFSGTMLDGTKRLKTPKGEELNHFFCQSSFAEYAIIHESAAIPVEKDLPIEKMAVFSCGMSTGIGMVRNISKVVPGSRVAVFGCGGVGLMALWTAKLVPASMVIAIDTIDNKLKMAKEFGATHVINASREDPVQKIIELTGGGVDYSFECIGNVKVIEQAYNAVHPGGLAVVAGAAPAGERVSIEALSLVTGKTLMGCVGGSTIASVDIPKNIGLYKKGLLPLDKFITSTYKLEEINQVFEAMQKGELARSIIVM